MVRKIETIVNDQEQGSTTLFQQTIFALLSMNDDELCSEIKFIAGLLQERFPFMGLFQKLVSILLKNRDPQVLRYELKEIELSLTENIQLIKSRSRCIFPRNATIMTISNSGLVKESLLAGNAVHPIKKVFCIRSGPMNEGDLIAKSISENGIPTEVLPDRSYQKKLGETDIVMVGCDLLTDSFFINKHGTGELASKTLQLQIPLWIVTDSHRFLKSYKRPTKLNEIFEIIPFKNNFSVLSNLGFFDISRVKSYFV
jgi:translation initiation factor 2B subunit (eIF-2B alpha/beta/delta family)